jgi:lipid-A-disaccharide synthase
MKKRVLLLAGEKSGLIYARRIEAELKRRFADGVEIRGYGSYGFAVGDLAVMGFWAVIKRLFFFLKVKRTMEMAIREWPADIVCTVDYPGMNLKLASYAKRLGRRAVHVVCPQVWAWKAGRIPRIEASLDALCCFFPFEPALFRPGFAEFIGHPLVEEFADAGKPRAEGENGRKLLAVLPGSRIGEIEHHLPVLLEAARILRRDRDLRVVIPAANEKSFAAIGSIVARSAMPSVEVQRGHARELLLSADAAAVASGTATLEAALANCPTVLVYKVGALLAWFARLVIKGIKHVGLANIIAEKSGTPCPMPELLQEDFTAEAVAKVLAGWLDDEDAASAERRKLAETMRLLAADGDSISRIVDRLTGMSVSGKVQGKPEKGSL